MVSPLSLPGQGHPRHGGVREARSGERGGQDPLNGQVAGQGNGGRGPLQRGSHASIIDGFCDPGGRQTSTAFEKVEHDTSAVKAYEETRPDVLCGRCSGWSYIEDKCSAAPGCA